MSRTITWGVKDVVVGEDGTPRWPMAYVKWAERYFDGDMSALGDMRELSWGGLDGGLRG